MPRPGSTKLAPSPTRPVLTDLRSKVIGTNTLITELTAEIRGLVEAQHALVTAMAELVTKSAKTAHAVAVERHLTVPEQETMRRALTRSSRLVAHGDTLIGADANDRRAEQAVPRGTETFIGAGHTHQIEADDPIVPPRTGHIDAALAAELFEYADEDDELPEPPDDAEQDDLWSRRLSLHRSMAMWKPEWGPRPGQSGCVVPTHLLNRRG